MWRSSKIIQLINDNFRKSLNDGKVLLSQGVRALPDTEIIDIMVKVSKFNEFNQDNDPHEEHDYGSFEHNDNKIIWKIDYYDKNYEYASENPADVTKTNRVLTIMLSDEY